MPHIPHRRARRRRDRRDGRVEGAVEVVAELHLGDALDEPPAASAASSRRCLVRRPRASDVPDGRRPPVPSAGRGRRCRTWPGRTRVGERPVDVRVRPRHAARGRRRHGAPTPTRRPRRGSVRRGYGGSADPRATGRVESVGHPLQRHERAEPRATACSIIDASAVSPTYRVMSTTVRGGLVTRMPSGRCTTSSSGNGAVRNVRTHGWRHGLLRGGAITWTSPSRGLRRSSHIRPAVGPATTT